MFKIIALSISLMILIIILNQAEAASGSYGSVSGFGPRSVFGGTSREKYTTRSPFTANNRDHFQIPRPEPYQFSFESTDEYGTRLVRSEAGDANGHVAGSYMFRDGQNGLYRTVKYEDRGAGFQATVQTNEPGVISHRTGDAEYLKDNN